MTRVLLCPCDREGCGRYRIGLPTAALQQQEKSLELYLSEGLPVRLDLGTGRALGLADGFEKDGWDSVVIQRPMSYFQIQCLRDCRRLGIFTVVEVDDDFEALHWLAPAWFQTHPKLSGDDWNRKWLNVACREADLVTVTTPALADRYGQHGRVVVLPNYIPERWLQMPRVRTEDVILGWTGNVGTHQGDLKVTRGGIAQAIRDTDCLFRVIGRYELVKRDLALDDEPHHIPWQKWEHYPRQIASFDVGIAPLADTAFNRAKSALKPLEYAALGVPSVVSPLPSYAALAAQGIGVLAKDQARDWRRKVRQLIMEPQYRAELSAQGREVAAGLTIEKNAWRFAEAWTGAGVLV